MSNVISNTMAVEALTQGVARDKRLVSDGKTCHYRGVADMPPLQSKYFVKYETI